jgi:hypothetical protein
VSVAVTGATYSTRLSRSPDSPCGSHRSSPLAATDSAEAPLNQPDRTLSRSVPAVCPMAPMTASGVGRSAGSSRRQDSTSGSRLSGTPFRSKSRVSTRSRITESWPSPKGSRPLAAYASTAPRAKTSLGGPTWPPLRICSGET